MFLKLWRTLGKAWISGFVIGTSFLFASLGDRVWAVAHVAVGIAFAGLAVWNAVDDSKEKKP